MVNFSEMTRMYERLDIQKTEEKEEARLKKELERLNRKKDRAELQREIAEEEVRKEKEVHFFYHFYLLSHFFPLPSISYFFRFFHFFH